MMMDTSAQAEEGKFYVSGAIGLGSLTDYENTDVKLDFNTGFSIQGAVGYDAGPFRVEGEIAFLGYTIDSVLIKPARIPPVVGDTLETDSDASVFTFMANGYYDIEIPKSNWTPSVGLGFGLVKAETESTSRFLHTEEDGSITITDERTETSSNSTEFAYQAMLGLDYEVFEGLNWTVGYRFFGYTNNNGVFAHELNVGLRVVAF